MPTTPSDVAVIRSVHFSNDPAMVTALRQLGSGEVDTKGIIFADLTGDGREEAVVPVTSGGTLGNIAYFVYTMNKGAPEVVLTRRLDKGSAGGLKMSVADGKLLETAAEYGPEDPLCCPSVFKKTTFRWDGKQLQVEREDREKATPTAKQLN